MNILGETFQDDRNHFPFTKQKREDFLSLTDKGEERNNLFIEPH